jgi:hypothetical protein
MKGEEEEVAGRRSGKALDYIKPYTCASLTVVRSTSNGIDLPTAVGHSLLRSNRMQVLYSTSIAGHLLHTTTHRSMWTDCSQLTSCSVAIII